jgi:hypothetical protein
MPEIAFLKASLARIAASRKYARSTKMHVALNEQRDALLKRIALLEGVVIVAAHTRKHPGR